MSGEQTRYCEKMSKNHDNINALIQILEKMPNGSFAKVFQALIDETRAHFDFENALMAEDRQFDSHAHRVAHRNFLSRLEKFSEENAENHLEVVRAFVRTELPDWFESHVETFDSILQDHLRESAASVLQLNAVKNH